MRFTLVIGCALGLLLAPSTARAIEVMCQNEQGGACTLDSDAGTFDCTCDGAPFGGTTGGSMNPWADLDEAELMAECEELLPPDCSLGESTTSGGSDGADETGPATTTPDTNGTDPSGPNSDTNESDPGTISGGESSGGESDDDDDDDKGCSIGATDRAPWLALLVACAWRRRVRSAAC